MTETEILLFTPKHELDFEKNIADFISEVESAPNPNSKMNYSSYYWAGLGNFTKMGVNSRKKINLLGLMTQLLGLQKLT